MSYKSNFIFFISVIFLIVACASSEQTGDDVQVRIIQSEINAWLDLMPGPSPGKFYVNGNIIMKNTGAGDVDNIKLTTITVYSEQEIIYSFTPYFSPGYKEDDYTLKSGLEKEFVFGTETGLKISEKLEGIETIDLKFSITFGEGHFNYDVKNISVERAY